MTTRQHQAPVDLVRRRPGIAAELLRDLFQVALPAFVDAQVQSPDLSQLQPTEFRADLVVALRDARGDPVVAVVMEVQRSCDPDKRYSWPVYLTTLRSRLRCDVWLIVVACDLRTERWAEEPIVLGHRELVLKPVVVGPSSTPLIIDPEEVAERPWLAVLSVLTHPDHVQRDVLLRALLDGVKGLEGSEALMYVEIARFGLPDAARKHLEALVSTEPEYESSFFGHAIAKGEAKGKAEGEAKAILTVLATRGVKVSKDVRERIQSCTDLTQLTEWVKRAVTVSRADDLFA